MCISTLSLETSSTVVCGSGSGIPELVQLSHCMAETNPTKGKSGLLNVTRSLPAPSSRGRPCLWFHYCFNSGLKCPERQLYCGTFVIRTVSG